MKTIKLLFAILLMALAAHSQQLEITFDVSNYYGSNVACAGNSDAFITATVVNAVGPCTYSWAPNGENTKDLSGIPAGIYTLFVTDSVGDTASRSIEIIEPNVLEVTLSWGNLSWYQSNDGSISATVNGGTPPYSLIWNGDSSLTDASMEGLAAGDYTVTITDMNGCSLTSSATITEPDALVITSLTTTDVTCYKGNNGAVQLEVSGGVPPYSYVYIHYTDNYKEEVKDSSSLFAGNYWVGVSDDNGAWATQQFTINQPDPLKVSITGSHYSDGKEFNVSCNECADAWLQLSATGGTSPYTYDWDTMKVKAKSEFEMMSNAIPKMLGVAAEGIYAQRNWFDGGATLHNLSAAEYYIKIADDNGCEVSDVIDINNNPDGTYWKMNGNSGINSVSQFMGTKDSADFVVKTNNEERLRIDAGGQIGIRGTVKLDSLVGNGDRNVYVDSNGVLKAIITQPICYNWLTCGNSIPNADNYFLGTSNGVDLAFKTNRVENMRINAATGNLLIGTTEVADSRLKIQINHTDDKGGLGFNNTGGTSAHSEIFFMKDGEERYGIGNDLLTTGANNFFIWDNNAGLTRLLLDENGNLGIGTETPSARLDISGNLRVGSLANNGTQLLQVNGNGELGYSTFDFSNLNLWSVNGNDIYRQSGNVGIGISSPSAKLDVGGQLAINDNKLSFRNATDDFHTAQYVTGQGITFTDNEGITFKLGNPATNSIFFSHDGKVGIGTTPPSSSSYNLFVEGGIATRDIKVKAIGWPDYVFEKEYKMLSIMELEKFIASEHHLPDLPSAEEVKKNEGFEVGDMQSKLLQKLEEQSLYIISLQRQVDELKQQVATIKK